ncbi:5-oxoprolinase subunit PxpB [Seonamhaeicola sp. MEBiC1930]|uniref:5-oxoprolinase subunit PxpB n=1 Tax=Seonamhaeicola sp. MEBiC01930 TaxID=2976768 RepID=UPI0032520290
MYNLIYKPYGERSILIEWPQDISEKILYYVLSFKRKITESKIEGLAEVNHAYCSLLITYRSSWLGFVKSVEVLKSLYKTGEISLNSTFRLWKIPVCYDISFGIDLEGLANANSLTVKNIIETHSQKIYTVYFVGFLPGFLYLGGLDESLFHPRKANPRLKIEKGSVAIGGNQTGVYPTESPGGWNIIGNSPINFFNIKNEAPCFASSGDQIQFYPISKNEHTDIKTLVEAGVYQIESEVIHD